MTQLNIQQNDQPQRKRPLLRLLTALAVLYAFAVLVLSFINTVQPRRTGLLGLSEVFAPYLFLPLLLFVPLLFAREARLLRFLLILCAVVYGLRFPPRLIYAAPQTTPGAIKLNVLSWNVLHGGWKEEIVKVLQSTPAAIVGLTEADWGWLQTDSRIIELYPYKAGVQAGSTVTGQVLLTRYPIVEQGIIDSPAEVWSGVPRAIWARLDVGLGRTVVVVVAHPPPGKICGRDTFPRGCYNTGTRDLQLATISAFVQPYLKAGDPLLLIGDFNVTEREPAYNEISTGLIDTHHAVGQGIGNTWGPGTMSSQLFPILRIDYMFASPGIVPLNTGVDCSPHGSDHCIVSGTFEIE